MISSLPKARFALPGYPSHALKEKTRLCRSAGENSLPIDASLPVRVGIFTKKIVDSAAPRFFIPCFCGAAPAHFQGVINSRGVVAPVLFGLRRYFASFSGLGIASDTRISPASGRSEHALHWPDLRWLAEEHCLTASQIAVANPPIGRKKGARACR